MICSARSSAASVSESNSRSAVLSKILNRAALAACALTLASPGIALGQTVPVSRADLCVTEGAIDESGGALLSVDSAKMRAYLNNATRQFVEARFTYLGPTATSARLGSGELRSQFGLKLRAADACNLIYAMWRFEPESKLVVSVKANPSEHSSAECGNRGYRNVKPRRFSKFPPARTDEGFYRSVLGLGRTHGCGRSGYGRSGRHSLGQRSADNRTEGGRIFGGSAAAAAHVPIRRGKLGIAPASVDQILCLRDSNSIISKSLERASRARTPKTPRTISVTIAVVSGKRQNSHSMVAADTVSTARSAAILPRVDDESVMPALLPRINANDSSQLLYILRS
jgi:hypothetical protein